MNPNQMAAYLAVTFSSLAAAAAYADWEYDHDNSPGTFWAEVSDQLDGWLEYYTAQEAT